MKKTLQEEKQRILKMMKSINEQAFNDAGEPMMTHQQYRDYSEPSEPDLDDQNDGPDIEEPEGNPDEFDNDIPVHYEGEWFSVLFKQPKPVYEERYIALIGGEGTHKMTTAILDEDFKPASSEKWNAVEKLVEKFLNQNYRR